MNIKRVDNKRLKNRDSHPFFKGKNELWHKLVVGTEVDIPDDVVDSVIKWFGKSLQVVKNTITNKKSDKGDVENG